MRKLGLGVLAVTLLASCSVQKNVQKTVQAGDVQRILNTLASDEMQGRAAFSPGIDKAAAFIENEFRQIGIQPLEGEAGFRQSFSVTRIRPVSQSAEINGTSVDPSDLMIVTDQPSIAWNDPSAAEVIRIGPGQQFFGRFREITGMQKPVLVLVDRQYADAFARLKANVQRGRIVQEAQKSKSAAVFVLGGQEPSSLKVTFSNSVEAAPLFNVAGMLKGKSKPDEIVVFSAHYDHLGVVKPLEGDSIANGADDDASGTTAVIELARHFKKAGDNERTIIFVAFTAEEIGGYGSRYFSSKLDPAKVMAMFNIEMIGKESKFGTNAAFITGYERSDFGKILQKNLDGTAFTFHPDPYPEQQLFYRSDNATLAALGVPAHTISTDKIDVDKFYHTVNDELETLDVQNITNTIKAIALSSRSIIDGTDTPSRIPPLEGRK
ncbi:MAG TPA: M20/M25/M40 family metallo-hydrolase [Sphingobacteriaceae bacterium]